MIRNWTSNTLQTHLLCTRNNWLSILRAVLIGPCSSYHIAGHDNRGVLKGWGKLEKRLKGRGNWKKRGWKRGKRGDISTPLPTIKSLYKNTPLHKSNGLEWFWSHVEGEDRFIKYWQMVQNFSQQYIQGISIKIIKLF